MNRLSNLGCAMAFATLAVCSTTPPARAADQEAWASEPDAFLGIRLAEPFTVAACPVKVGAGGDDVLDFVSIRKLEGVCFNPLAPGIKYAGAGGPTWYEVHNAPAIGPEYKVMVQMSNGVVSRINLELDQSGFGALQAALVSRYGKPTSMEVKSFMTKAGGEFPSSTLRWEGRKMAIRMYERFGRVDRSQVIVYDVAMLKQEMEAEKRRLEGEAKKF